MLHVTNAEYRGDYRIWLEFNDGSSGEADLRSALTGSIFAPLTSINEFRQFQLDSDAHTLVWPNGADFAPEFLRDLISVEAPNVTG